MTDLQPVTLAIPLLAIFGALSCKAMYGSLKAVADMRNILRKFKPATESA